MAKTLEQKYKKLTDIDHVLLRPGMYIGSINSHNEDCYIYDDDENKFKLVNVTYNPGFLKIFDEIVSNSVDESKRNNKLNKIKVTIDTKNGIISCYDNGGIPVEIHKEYKQYIPEMIFSNMKAGSNFDDSEDRTVVGTNGVGSTCTNIFSKEFIVETADKKNKFKQVFYNNMKSRSTPKVEKCRDHFTKITYTPDLERFGMSCIDNDTIKMIDKRLFEIAACNSNLSVEFEVDGRILRNMQFYSFIDYANLFCDDSVIYEESKDWKIGVGMSLGSHNNISFVNSVETKDGGTHCAYISNQIITYLRERIKKKYKVDVKPNDIRQHFSLFINCTIINPAFSSQTKEKLITEQKNFGTEHVVSEKFLKKIFDSDIIKTILDWAKKKNEAEDAAALRKAQKDLDKIKVQKLIDAQKKGLRDDCIFQIYEGDSANSSFRKYRNPQLHGALPIRGKFVNVYNLEPNKVMQNEEAKNICAALGLKIGEKATSKNLRYGKIYIYSDADTDGDCIAGLLLNFFYKYWPELVEDGRIFRVETPIVVAKKGKTVNKFYYDNEYQEWVNGIKDINSWNIEYKKGLAALEDDEYKEIIQTPKIFQFTKDSLSDEQFRIWFGDDSQPRKDKILGNYTYKPIEKEVKKVEKTKDKSVEEKKNNTKKKKVDVNSLKNRLKKDINETKKSVKPKKLF